MRNVFIILVVFLGFSFSNSKKIKSIIKIQNDFVIGIQNFDSLGNLIFKKEISINKDTFTLIRGYKYENNRKIYEYFIHSNLSIQVIKFEYDQDSRLRDQYFKGINNSAISFEDSKNINNFSDLVKYINSKIPDTIQYSGCNGLIRHLETELYTYNDNKGEIFYEFIDSDKLLTKIRKKDNSKFNYKYIEKYFENGRLYSIEKLTDYNHSIQKFKYDDYGNLIEDLKIWDVESNGYQKKNYYYDKNRLIKMDFYHGDKIAFQNEYYYQDTLLIKEIDNRFTEEKNFLDIEKNIEYVYHYEYY